MIRMEKSIVIDFGQYLVGRRVDEEKKTLRYIRKNDKHSVTINAANESMAMISLY